MPAVQRLHHSERSIVSRATIPPIDAVAALLVIAYLRILERRTSQGSSAPSGDAPAARTLVANIVEVSPSQSVSVRTPAGSPSGTTKKAPR